MRRFEFETAADMPVGFWTWKHIDPFGEWACNGTGKLIVVPNFMDRFEALRKVWNGPLVITSGYRSPEYNARVAKTGLDGPHTTGQACDIAMPTSGQAYKLAELAFRYGFTGIGVSQRAGQPRFVHLDDLPGDGKHPRPGLWSY